MEKAEVRAEWEEVRARVRAQLDDSHFQSWIQPLRVVERHSDRVLLAAPSRFLRDWVQSNYLGLLQTAYRKVDPRLLLVELTVRAPKPAPLRAAAEADARAAGTGGQSAASAGDGLGSGLLSVTARKPAASTALSIDSPLDSDYRFERFIVAPPNELAVAAARRVVESDRVTFNPLVIYGGVGLGKTHLLQSIGWAVRSQRPERQVAYISAEKFLYRFVRAVRERNTDAFKEEIRSVDVLLIDDLQYIAGGEATQREFVQTFNALFENNRQIVVAVNRAPSELKEFDERLRSRLMGGLSVDLQPSSRDLRLGVLRQKVMSAGVSLSDEVLTFVADRINSNIREVEGAVNRLIAHATLMNGSIGIEAAQDILKDLLRTYERRLSIEDIQRQTARHFNIRFTEMHSARRARAVARPRQVAMYLSKLLTARSLPEIGRSFGGRDHTTVMHAIRKIEELKADDLAFAEQVESLRRQLEQ